MLRFETKHPLSPSQTREVSALSNQIHPSALIADDVSLGSGNVIGPYVVIEDDVVLGDDNRIAAHAVIKRGTRLGNANRIFEHAAIGGDPQDLSFAPETRSYLRLGDENVLREAVTIHRASKEEASTLLGNGNFLMSTSHIGHDCRVGDRTVLAPSSGLGGHVTVEDRAFISGGVMVHQFTHIGSLAMLGGNSKITQDCLPYMVVDGHPGRVRGLNIVGLRRTGCSREDLRLLKEAYRIVFRSGMRLEAILAHLEELTNPYAAHLAAAIRNAKRGFHREEE